MTEASVDTATTPPKPRAPAGVDPTPPRPRIKPTAPIATAGPIAKSYTVQLSSVPTAAGAEQERRKLAARLPTLLKAADVTISAAEVPGRGTFYRLQTGSFSSLAAARKACADFTAQRQRCLVIRR
jgi:hypothetical protein